MTTEAKEKTCYDIAIDFFEKKKREIKKAPSTAALFNLRATPYLKTNQQTRLEEINEIISALKKMRDVPNEDVMVDPKAVEKVLEKKLSDAAKAILKRANEEDVMTMDSRISTLKTPTRTQTEPRQPRTVSFSYSSRAPKKELEVLLIDDSEEEVVGTAADLEATIAAAAERDVKSVHEHFRTKTLF